MVTAILTHEVKDYAEWRKGFDADDANRAGMGVSITGVFQSVENPNMITVISEVPSVEAIQAFMANPDLMATMEKAGVIGKPDMKILNNCN